MSTTTKNSDCTKCLSPVIAIQRHDPINRTRDEIVDLADNRKRVTAECGHFFHNAHNPAIQRTSRSRFKGKAKNVQKFPITPNLLKSLFAIQTALLGVNHSQNLILGRIASVLHCCLIDMSIRGFNLSGRSEVRENHNLPPDEGFQT